MKIACWSGPRNLSTAMMYSFANRPDFDVLDEPFYAPFLRQSGLLHPMATEIIAAHESDWNKAAAICDAPGIPHIYQKHMTHHILKQTPMDWAEDAAHIFLIRHPARVLASYNAKRDQVTLDDIGIQQQIDIYEEYGGIIVDSEDLRANPQAMLRALCAGLDLDFDPAMLSWPQGGTEADGIWAEHWYETAHESTGFAGPEGPLPDLSGELAELCEEALPTYAILKMQRLTA